MEELLNDPETIKKFKLLHHILLSKIGYKKTIITLIILIVMPILLRIINIDTLPIIIISLFFYIFLIYKFKK